MSVKRHTAYNLAGAIAPAAIMLVSVPLYFSLVGEARYGVLAIVWLLTGSFGFFDFGLGRATAFALSSQTQADEAERERIFWTAIIVNLGFGVIGGLVMLALAPLLFVQIFNIPDNLLAELSPVLPLLALAIPLLTLEGVLTGALTGREKFFALNIRTVIGAVVTQMIPLAFVWLIAPTLTVAVQATIIARAVNVSFFLVVAFKAVPAGMRPRFGGIAMVRNLTGYGGWISLGALLNPIIAAIDRFLIATFLNPTSVAFYVVPFDLVTRGAMFSRALTNALFPKLAKNDPEAARALALKGMHANAALMLVLCLSGMVIMEPFLTIWIGQEFAQEAAFVGELIAISLWLNAVSLVPFNLLQAQGRPRDTTIILIIQVIPFLAIAIPGVYIAGIVGAALARNVRSVVDFALLAKRANLLRESAALALVPLTILGFNLLIIRTISVLSIWGAIASATLFLTATAWGLWISPELRALAIPRIFRSSTQ